MHGSRKYAAIARPILFQTPPLDVYSIHTRSTRTSSTTGTKCTWIRKNSASTFLSSSLSIDSIQPYCCTRGFHWKSLHVQTTRRLFMFWWWFRQWQRWRWRSHHNTNNCCSRPTPHINKSNTTNFFPTTITTKSVQFFLYWHYSTKNINWPVHWFISCNNDCSLLRFWYSNFLYYNVGKNHIIRTVVVASVDSKSVY